MKNRNGFTPSEESKGVGSDINRYNIKGMSMTESKMLKSETSLTGFTLMEVLVVISIIAILAGILMPSVVAVKRMAKRAMSETLIANLGMGLETYSSDFSGYYPPDVKDNPSHIKAGESLENSAKLLCYFLESQNISDDGRKSGSYISIKPANKLDRGVDSVGETDVNGITLKFSKDYVVDAFGGPIGYDERKSEGLEKGMNPLTFVLVSGSAFDKAEAIEASDLLGEDLEDYTTDPRWGVVKTTMDTKRALYETEIIVQDENNDDIINK